MSMMAQVRLISGPPKTQQAENVFCTGNMGHFLRGYLLPALSYNPTNRA